LVPFLLFALLLLSRLLFSLLFALLLLPGLLLALLFLTLLLFPRSLVSFLLFPLLLLSRLLFALLLFLLLLIDLSQRGLHRDNHQRKAKQDHRAASRLLNQIFEIQESSPTERVDCHNYHPFLRSWIGGLSTHAEGKRRPRLVP
jgi:membrane protein implicated in regulation of membrane protease activity